MLFIFHEGKNRINKIKYKIKYNKMKQPKYGNASALGLILEY